MPKKLLSKCPLEFGFFSPDAYAVPGVRAVAHRGRGDPYHV